MEITINHGAGGELMNELIMKSITANISLKNAGGGIAVAI